MIAINIFALVFACAVMSLWISLGVRYGWNARVLLWVCFLLLCAIAQVPFIAAFFLGEG